MFFDHPLRSVTEIIVLGERRSTIKLISSELLLKMSEDFCVNENFFSFFLFFIVFTSSLSALRRLWVIYYRHQVVTLFTEYFLKMDVEWGRTDSGFFVYVPLLIFLVYFYNYFSSANSHNSSVDKIKKSSKVLLEQGKSSNDYCFFEENESFQLDRTVRSSCVICTC